MPTCLPTPASADTSTVFTPPAPNEIWPGQGGIYLGICRSDALKPAEHLILVTDPRAAFTGTWGKYGQDVPEAKSRFDGRANTIAMAAAGSEIAQRILALEVDGHNDLFIGSQAQLQLACAIAPERFEKGYHWSSTQYSRYLAFGQDFEFGSSNWYGKANEHRVRAFRGLPLQTFKP